jgi:hypothetical protein
MRVRWQCIYYGTITANKRNLEDHVERNEKDKIINRRKQESIYVS